MGTLSEAIQKLLNKNDCPFLEDCSVAVTKDFFSRICKSPAYLTCQHFAERMNELQTPITWLQKFAVDQAKPMNYEQENI